MLKKNQKMAVEFSGSMIMKSSGIKCAFEKIEVVLMLEKAPTSIKQLHVSMVVFDLY
ncbi:MAG: hypothetical protein AB2693_31305 [Candidatus Thiodiazotropha sp.]